MVYTALRSLRFWRSLVFILFFAARAEAASVTLVWDPSPDPAVIGYTVAYGIKPGNYTSFVNVASTTRSFTFSSLPIGTFYFAVRAYGPGGMVSSFSNEVVATLGTSIVAAPTSCATPDPFASLGGGTCYNGGWLPPGMPIPGSTAPAPVPAPAPAPSTSGQGCTTPDPFASLGGGTCYNGGWLPPGMPVPGGGTTAAPAPAPAPSTSTQGCTTPDPFASLGGGICYSGGWLPPGMPIPGGGSTAPSGATPTAPSMPVNTVCASPDPFLSLGGGTCHSGDWLPPGIQVTVTGTLTVLSDEDGRWAIEGDDGVVYTSPTALAPEQLVDGANVTLHGLTLPQTMAPDGMVVLEVILLEIHP